MNHSSSNFSTASRRNPSPFITLVTNGGIFVRALMLNRLANLISELLSCSPWLDLIGEGTKRKQCCRFHFLVAKGSPSTQIFAANLWNCLGKFITVEGVQEANGRSETKRSSCDRKRIEFVFNPRRCRQSIPLNQFSMLFELIDIQVVV